MLRVTIVLLAGCHIGGGPIIAYSPQGGVRVGAEASGGVAVVRASVGGTFAPFTAGQQRMYGTFDPGYMIDANRKIADRDMFYGFGGTIGKAYGDEEQDDGLAIGAYVAPLAFENRCDNELVEPTFSVAIGYRNLSGVDEIYVTPKVGGIVSFLPCE